MTCLWDIACCVDRIGSVFLFGTKKATLDRECSHGLIFFFFFFSGSAWKMASGSPGGRSRRSCARRSRTSGGSRAWPSGSCARRSSSAASATFSSTRRPCSRLLLRPPRHRGRMTSWPLRRAQADNICWSLFPPFGGVLVLGLRNGGIRVSERAVICFVSLVFLMGCLLQGRTFDGRVSPADKWMEVDTTNICGSVPAQGVKDIETWGGGGRSFLTNGTYACLRTYLARSTASSQPSQSDGCQSARIQLAVRVSAKQCQPVVSLPRRCSQSNFSRTIRQFSLALV